MSLGSVLLFLTVHLVLDAAQVYQAEVARKDGLEGGKGLQRRDAAPFWQDGQRQDFVVQDGVCHVTQYRREASCCTVHHLEERQLNYYAIMQHIYIQSFC